MLGRYIDTVMGARYRFRPFHGSRDRVDRGPDGLVN
jgi:hypothetical protein